MSGPGEGLPPAVEREPDDRPRIYVASLTDYNAGILHGTWLDATDTAEGLQDGIDLMLATSPTTRRYGEVAEEWAIHDYEGFGPVRLGEWESLDRLSMLARGINAHGEAFAAWWANDEPEAHDEAEITEAFEESYQGEFSSLEEYGEQLLEDFGFNAEELPGIPESLQLYISFDVEGWTRDMVIGGEIFTVDSRGGVHVFRA